MESKNAGPSESTKARLEALRLKRQEAKAANRKVLTEERKKELVKHVPEEELKEETGRNTNYTIRQCEEWENRPKGQTDTNYNKLASNTYHKLVRNLEVDEESYNNQMKMLNKYNLDALNDEEKMKLLTSHSPSDEDKQMLADLVTDARNRKRTRTQKEEGNAGEFINEKNRQFNMKLNREQEQRQAKKEAALKDRS